MFWSCLQCHEAVSVPTQPYPHRVITVLLRLVTNSFYRKSQIALEYAYRFRQQHRQVFWVHAADKFTFDQAYQSIAENLKIPGLDNPEVDTRQLVHEWLTDEDHGPWLMILDNADDTELFFLDRVFDPPPEQNKSPSVLASYIPRNSKGSILVTTRNSILGKDLADGNTPLKIEQLSPPDAGQLLKSKTPDDRWDGADACKLVEALGCLPLAITQSAAYMSNNNLSLNEYLAKMEDHELKQEEYLSAELHDPAFNEGALDSGDPSFDIQSLPGLTVGSTVGSVSSVHEQVLEAAEEFASLLLDDEKLNQLFTIAIKRIGASRFRRDITKLLKGFANGLRKEASSDLEHGAVELVGTRVHYIVSLLRWEQVPNEENFVISKGMDGLSTQDPQKQQRVEEILQAQSFIPHAFSTMSSNDSLNTNLPHGIGDKYTCLWPGCASRNPTFKRQYELDRHQKSHHMSARLYYCHVTGCERGVGGTGFRRADKYSEHVRAKHAGESGKVLQAQSFIPQSSFTKRNSLLTQQVTSLEEVLHHDDMDAVKSEAVEAQLPEITNLAPVKPFIVNSTAFVKLREDVWLLVFPLPTEPLSQPHAKLSPPLDDSMSMLHMDDTGAIEPEIRRKESSAAPDAVTMASDWLPGRLFLRQALLTIWCSAISLAVAILYEKPLRTGFERVRWTCVSSLYPKICH